MTPSSHAPHREREVPAGIAVDAAPLPRTDADTWNEVAAEWRQGKASLWRAHSDAVYAALLDRWLPAGRLETLLKTDLFDEAVSAGLYPLLAARAQHVMGIDVARVTAHEAVSRHPRIGAAAADVRALPFADGSFDAIVSLSTLDHFRAWSDLDAGVAELRRVLRAGGTLVLTLDNLANPLIRVRNLLPFSLVHGAGLVPYFVGRSCSPRAAAALLRRHGLRVEEQTTVVHVPRVAAVPATALAARWGSASLQARVLRGLARWERLASWPTRALTGHYVALRATKPRT